MVPHSRMAASGYIDELANVPDGSGATGTNTGLMPNANGLWDEVLETGVSLSSPLVVNAASAMVARTMMVIDAMLRET